MKIDIILSGSVYNFTEGFNLGNKEVLVAENDALTTLLWPDDGLQQLEEGEVVFTLDSQATSNHSVEALMALPFMDSVCPMRIARTAMPYGHYDHFNETSKESSMLKIDMTITGNTEDIMNIIYFGKAMFNMYESEDETTTFDDEDCWDAVMSEDRGLLVTQEEFNRIIAENFNRVQKVELQYDQEAKSIIATAIQEEDSVPSDWEDD